MFMLVYRVKQRKTLIRSPNKISQFTFVQNYGALKGTWLRRKKNRWEKLFVIAFPFSLLTFLSETFEFARIKHTVFLLVQVSVVCITVLIYLNEECPK